METLVQRLREFVTECHGHARAEATFGATMSEAADEIERLEHDLTRHMLIAASLATENERLRGCMRNVASWLNNGCEPSKGAAELLLVAGPPE